MSNKYITKYITSFSHKNFFSIDMLLHIHLRNIKTLSAGTNKLGVPGKNIKKKFLIKELTKNK